MLPDYLVTDQYLIINFFDRPDHEQPFQLLTMTTDVEIKKIMTADEITAKKELLKTNGTSPSPQNGTTSPLTNGNGNGHTSPTVIAETQLDTSSPPSPCAETTPLPVSEKIAQKRKQISQITEALASEEAKYTVLKKIRLSQLSTENANKAEANKIEESTSHAKPPTSAASVKSSSTSDQKFKPIKPAISTSGKSTPVLSPTPNKVNSPKVMHKPMNAKDLDDVHQLANFLATNPRMSEHDIKSAKKLVFRKQLQKTLAECPPPEKEQPDIIFFPSNNSAEFVNLVGLEQVVTHIKAMNAKKKEKEGKPISYSHLSNAHDWKVQPRVIPPMAVECIQCGTDFSPQWFENKETKGTVYCLACVNANKKKIQVKNYNKQLKETFGVAVKHQQEMEKELKTEYEKRSKEHKADEEKRRLANKQIKDLQRQTAERQKILQQQQALKQQQELQKMMQQRKAQRQSKQNNASSNVSSALSNLGSSNNQSSEILRVLLQQLSQNQNANNQGDIQKVLALLQSQILSSGFNKQQEIMQLLKLQVNQLQADQQRKQQEEARKKQQEELRKRREAEERQRRLEEQRRKAAAQEADNKKKREQSMAIQQLLTLIQNTNNAEQQQQLLQVLIQQTQNNREVQQRLVEHVLKLAAQNKKK